MMPPPPSKRLMFVFAGGIYTLTNPPSYENMKPRLNELERTFLSECQGRYYRSLNQICINPIMGDYDYCAPDGSQKLPIGPMTPRKRRGQPVLDVRCYFPSSIWDPLQNRNGFTIDSVPMAFQPPKVPPNTEVCGSLALAGKTVSEVRAGIADYMIDCKIAARSWLDKRNELLDSDKFERDFERALKKFRMADS